MIVTQAGTKLPDLWCPRLQARFVALRLQGLCSDDAMLETLMPDEMSAWLEKTGQDYKTWVIEKYEVLDDPEKLYWFCWRSPPSFPNTGKTIFITLSPGGYLVGNITAY